MTSIAEKEEAIWDRRTAPLREEVQEWARARGRGFSSGYVAAEHLWRFSAMFFQGALVVEVDEHGEWVKIGDETITEPTLRKIKLALNRWEKAGRP